MLFAPAQIHLMLFLRPHSHTLLTFTMPTANCVIACHVEYVFNLTEYHGAQCPCCGGELSLPRAIHITGWWALLLVSGSRLLVDRQTSTTSSIDWLDYRVPARIPHNIVHWIGELIWDRARPILLSEPSLRSDLSLSSCVLLLRWPKSPSKVLHIHWLLAIFAVYFHVKTVPCYSKHSFWVASTVHQMCRNTSATWMILGSPIHLGRDAA